MNLSDIGKLIAQHGAPLLGGILGGPAGASIGQIIASAFGGNVSDLDDLYKKISIDPESQIKLRQIQSDETINLQRLTFLQAELDVKNTMDARANNAKKNNYTPELLSLLIALGFFLCIYWIAAFKQEKADEQVLYLMLGVMGSAFNTVINYWLGSSTDKNYKLNK